MPKWVWWCVAIVLVLLFYDVAFSWLSTCDQISGYPTADQEYQKHCSAFGGPFISGLSVLADRLTILFDEHGEAVTAAFTVVLAISTILLWRSTERLWEASERQLAHLSEVAERELRGYVSILPTDIIIDPVGNACAFKATYRIANVGRTPAHRIQVDVDIRILPWRLPADTEIEDPLPNAIRFEKTLAGGETTTGSVEKTIPINLAAVDESKARVYVVGFVTYIDVFKKRRQTRVCGAFEGLSKMAANAKLPRPGPKILSTFHYAAQYNDSD